MQYVFSEVLNDLTDYFIVGDLLLLQRFKDQQQLSDDLASEFVSGESGDKAVREGVIIPLAGIENLPYTILFTLPPSSPELLKPESRLQHRRSGYALQVAHRRVQLFTWPILQHFTPNSVDQLLRRLQQPGRPTIEVENGWYQVEILGGEVRREGGFEPAFEFVLSKTNLPVECSGVDTHYRFTIMCSAEPAG
ncbi:MAG: hypothetical protein ABWY06_22880 [Pseudomonas sp.]|uniref:hypothetical protein n=1 Tax=Pseudomonas sp. TaxID=306 RepID=UPI0033967747